MGIQIKRKKLTKTLMMIPIEKNPLVSIVYTQTPFQFISFKTRILSNIYNLT